MRETKSRHPHRWHRDVKTVLTCLPKISDEEVSKDEFREWPAFQWIRTDSTFVTAFEEKFGEALEPDRGSADDIGTISPEALPAQSPAETLEIKSEDTT